MQTRLIPLRGLASGLVLFTAAWAGAEEAVWVAQAETPAASERPARPKASGSDIEEIVVLGTESDSSADFKTADSVTAFGADDLAALGAQSIADLASFTPNLEIVTAGSTTPTFFIRGVGLNDFNSNSTGAVAIYRDDVAINAPAIQLATLFDVEAVNILRGPQGSGLGRNASAGAIKIYSRKPTGEFGGFMRADFGNYDFMDYEGAVEAPIVDDLLSGRFAFRLSQRDGTMRNRCGDAPAVKTPYRGENGTLTFDAPWSICGEPVIGTALIPGFSDVPAGLERDVNNLDNWAARGTLRFEPTLDMSWLVGGHGARRDELSRLGQSYGTSGFYCKNGDICTRPPPSDPSLAGEATSGVLGGRQGSAGGGYQAPEVTARLIELLPCLATNDCGALLGRDGARVAQNRAKITVANELADELDSEPWKGDFNRTGSTTNDSYGGYLKGDIALPWGLQLDTTTAGDGYDRRIDIDLDMSPQTLFQIITDDEGWQLYQDATLSGAFGGNEDSGLLSGINPIRWDLGGWVLRERLDVTVSNDLGAAQAIGVGSREYVQKSWSLGAFAGFGFDFWTDFTLDGGVRYNYDQKDLDYTLLTGAGGAPENSKLDESWDAPTGTIRLTYRFREDTHAFWKYTRGWKPGTYNATSGQGRPVTVPEPETIDAFETGVRGSWFNGRFGLDGSLFYYHYTNYQIFTTQQFLGGNTEFVILNASDAEVYGAEVDASSRPWPGAFANVRFSWLESQFLDFTQVNQQPAPASAGGGLFLQQIQNSGNPLLNSPRYKVSITGEQTIQLGRYGAITGRYDGVWTDDTFYDATGGKGVPNIQNQQFLPEGTIAQNAYWLHNLRLSWRAPGGRVELAGWIRNLEDQVYKTFAFDASTFQQTTIYFVGDPRTYGGTLIVNF